MENFKIIETFTCNGALTGYQLINTKTGVILWDGDETQSYYNHDKFIQDFVQRMMLLSNALNSEDIPDGEDIKDEYLMDIRQFIAKTTDL